MSLISGVLVLFMPCMTGSTASPEVTSITVHICTSCEWPCRWWSVEAQTRSCHVCLTSLRVAEASQVIGIARHLLYASTLALCLHKIAWHEWDEHGALTGHVPGQAWPSLCHCSYLSRGLVVEWPWLPLTGQFFTPNRHGHHFHLLVEALFLVLLVVFVRKNVHWSENLTIESLLMSGCDQSHEPMNRRAQRSFDSVLALSRSGKGAKEDIHSLKTDL